MMNALTGHPMNLQTFFTEKDFDIQVYDVEVNNTFAIITTDVVIDCILRTTGAERTQIENILLQLDVGTVISTTSSATWPLALLHNAEVFA